MLGENGVTQLKWSVLSELKIEAAAILLHSAPIREAHNNGTREACDYFGTDCAFYCVCSSQLLAISASLLN
jgi:hypothetical protein